MSHLENVLLPIWLKVYRWDGPLPSQMALLQMATSRVLEPHFVTIFLFLGMLRKYFESLKGNPDGLSQPSPQNQPRNCCWLMFPFRRRIFNVLLLFSVSFTTMNTL